METVARFFFLLANWSVVLLVAAITLTVILVLASKAANHYLLRWLLRFAFLVSLSVSILCLVQVIRPHYLDGKLIYHYGKRADAKVLNTEKTNYMFNDEPVFRSNVIYRTETGQAIETSFDTWDFNIYPSAHSVRYPTLGQDFRVAYLPSYPATFVILTEESSPYRSAQECLSLTADLEQKRNKYLFDKKDVTFRDEYTTALIAAIQKGCGDQFIDELRSVAAPNIK